MTARRAALAALLAACAPTARERAPMHAIPSPVARGALPPIPFVDGPLALDVVYPPEGASIPPVPRTFVFGSTGSGRARLWIQGVRVPVAPNGAFLAFLPLPPDGVWRLEAERAGIRQRVERRVRVERPAVLRSTGGLEVWTETVEPRGDWALPEGAPLAVGVRASAGADAVLRLADGRELPLEPRPAWARVEGFGPERAERLAELADYRGLVPAGAALRGAALVLRRGPDRLVVPLPLRLELWPAETAWRAHVLGRPDDGQALATPAPPPAAPYHWLWPTGTELVVTGRREGAWRVRLVPGLEAWVDTAWVRRGLAGAAPPSAVGAVRLQPDSEAVVLRVRVERRVPFHVEADIRRVRLRLYDAVARTNWAYEGPADPFVAGLRWEVGPGPTVDVVVDLAEPLWGWRAAWTSDDALELRLRRPPRVDPARPLAGLRIAVDAGHPPLGATGPTRLREADANLAIARRLVRLLRADGAEVVETRPDTTAVPLTLRPVRATRAGAHLLVSIHNNAFPDGVDPWAHAGTTAFYYHLFAADLARCLQRALVHALGTRDLGVARADLALPRTSWMPAVLTESLFLMLPDHEAALRDPAVQERIARAHRDGLLAFLRQRLGGGPPCAPAPVTRQAPMPRPSRPPSGPS